MIALMFVACLSGSPDRCRTETLLFSDVSPLECLLRAQTELAGWTASRPEWTVRR